VSCSVILFFSLFFVFRANQTAPVDSMGCERLFQPNVPPKVRRYQILVSLMLSPQSKDENTKKSMENLWKLGELTPERIALMKQEDLEPIIKPSGLYRGKAKALIATAKMLLEKHKGEVPKTMKELTALAGIGPKIAALALSACWNMSDAIGCDIHVTRIAQRLGWAKGGALSPNDAESVRHDLEEWLPKSLWKPINYGLVGFGQTICAARPDCEICPAASVCPSATNPKLVRKASSSGLKKKSSSTSSLKKTKSDPKKK